MIDDDAMAKRIDAAIDAALGSRIVGAVLLVAREGRVIYRRAAGYLDREAGTPMREDAIFRFASLTKPLVAATALAMIDAGRFGLDDRVADHLPFFTPAFEGKPADLRIRHLMTHTAGITYDAEHMLPAGVTGGSSGPIIPLEENMRRLATIPLLYAPGSKWRYSLAIDVLGCIIAKLEGTSVGEVVERHVMGPLGMRDTRFGVSDVTRLAVPYADGKSEPIRMGDTTQVTNADGSPGTVFCPSRIFNPLAPQCGGSGMAGSAPEFLKFLEALRSGESILRRETFAAATRNQIGDVPMVGREPGLRFGLIGSILADPSAARSPAPAGTIAWGGVYGHHWFIDPVNKLTVVSCTNTAIEGCNGAYRDETRAAVYGPS